MHVGRQTRPIRSLRLAVIMVVGVLAMSSASIFIRWALSDGVPPLVIAAYRLSIASLVLSIPAVRQRAWKEYATLGTSRGILLGIGGVLLAIHFAAWITSLSQTSVLSSVVLVSTTPLWIGIASPIVLNERNPLVMWVGLCVSMVGVAIVGLADLSVTQSLARWGDALAVVGAVCAAGYLMVGRGARRVMPFIPYLWIVYGLAACVLVGWAIMRRLPLFGYPTAAFAWLIALGLVPQLIGHSAANYVIRHVSATLVGISVLGEPIGSTILAFVILNESPRPLQVLGAVVVLSGIVLASLVENSEGAKQESAIET